MFILDTKGQTLSDMLKVFDGLIDDIDYSDSIINIKGKTYVVPPVDIQGRKLNYAKQTIGEDAVASGYRIDKENDGRCLPVVFGRHWCAPAAPYIESKGSTTVGELNSKDRYFALHDSEYSSLINPSAVKTDIYQFNIGKADSLVTILNNDYLTPIHAQDWYADNYRVYDIDSTFEYGIRLNGPAKSYHTKTSDSIFLLTPLRYQTGSFDTPLTVDGFTSYGSYTELAKIFDNKTYASPYTLTHDPSQWLTFWAKLKLDAANNLRTDEAGHVRRNRLIHIPDVQSDNGQGYLFGRAFIDCGSFGYFVSGQWLAY